MNFQFKNFQKYIFPVILVCAFFALAKTSQAATYYVDATSGNDSWTGTAGAFTSGSTGPWKTVGKVNNFNFQTGDDVYFKCGERWDSTEVLNIDWNGMASISAVITAFTQGASGVTVTTKDNHGFLSGDYVTIEGTKDYDGYYPISQVSANQFIISHSYIPIGSPGYAGLLGFVHKGLNRAVIGSYYMDNGMALIGVSGERPVFDAHYPTTQYSDYGAIQIWDHDYITLENLQVVNQYRRGMSADYSKYTTVHNCYFSEILTSAIVYIHESFGGIFTDNEIYHAARDFPEDPVPYYSDWSAGMVANGYASYYVMRGSKIHHVYGEAMIHDWYASNGLIEYNIFYQNDRIGGPYLCDSRNATVRYNLIYNSISGGIVIAGEEHHSSPDFRGNFDVYGNFIADCRNNFELWGGFSSNAPAGYVLMPMKNINIYNNTAVSSRSESLFMDQWFDSVNIKNNIFWNPNGSGMAKLNINNYGVSSNINFDYNLWSSLPESDAVGDYDIISAAVLLSKTSDWHNISADSLFPDDFKLQPTSPAIDRGVALGPSYNLDYFSAARPQPAQGGWDIGAHEYTTGSGDTIAPGSPSGLVAR